MKNRKLLMIPGPIEFEPEVLQALGAPTTSHVDPGFIEAFGQSLEDLLKVFGCKDGQAFILAGSGTLGMDTSVVNLVEPGDNALVVNTGYFGDRMGNILERYGVNVTQVRAEIGGQPALDEVEAALSEKKYKLITITQVDTSTAVLADVQAYARLAKSAGALVVVDGVCSIAGEALPMDEWGVDVAFTASQKAIGVPPGLALVVANQKAMDTFNNRTSPVPNYYADWANWLPIMEAYQARKPAYFGTPAVNLIWALHKSLRIILQEGMDARVNRHIKISKAFQAALSALGLGQVPLSPALAAHTLTAPRYPEGVTGADLLPALKGAGVITAGGLHAEIKAEYFRVGHMGSVSQADIMAVISALETALAVCGYGFESGAGLSAAQQVLSK